LFFFFRGGCFWAPQTRAPSPSQSVDGILSDLLSFDIRSHKYYTDFLSIQPGWRVHLIGNFWVVNISIACVKFLKKV
jgi:hypothetical protein